MAGAVDGIAAEGTLFARLREAARPSWEAYVGHPFVKGLTDGSLPEAAFRRYLTQDYLFLIHFARAYGLAVVKHATLADMRSAAATLDALINHEMRLHVAYCGEWGITEASMEAEDEAEETMAYTRYVLERGLAGDVLDLEVALAPCVIGYAEIGARMTADAGLVVTGNRYDAWRQMYAGEEFQAVAAEAIARLDRLGAARGAEARFASLARTFEEACRLEARFWQMGLDAA
ncbi:MAG: thiaminase II [Acetobacteraceae bacterium]|jgi:thiaminase/transcriptional activator TenA|nr:thiaminase II [Acetobacteraceae bacterium]